jgi:serine phosphatase RsbU (regulator of sigma subunit)
MPRKILVTDDEVDLELLIKQMFRAKVKSGELVFDFAHDGQQALDLLSENPGYEVVLTDINMPVMNGLELLANIKSKGYEVKTIVISAYGDEKSIRTAMNQGAFDFINKPIDVDDLGATLTKSFQELDIYKKGKEAQNHLEQALIEKATAQAQSLEILRENEKLILKQNEVLEQQVMERTREILEQKNVIELKNQEILESIHYAKRLQEAILPDSSFLNGITNDNFLIYLPKDIVSGDFYWVRKTPHQMLAVADCTGHGVSGALMSMLGISLLDRIIDNLNESDPGIILDTLHQLVVESLRQKDYHSNEGMDIAILKFDDVSNTLSYAGANRPLWLVRDGELMITNPDKMPIGGTQYSDRLPYTTHKVKLETNDRVFIFSDGYSDQFGGAKGKKIMTSQFKEMIKETSNIPVKEQGHVLIKYLKDWQGDLEQVDDVLVLGIKI